MPLDITCSKSSVAKVDVSVEAVQENEKRWAVFTITTDDVDRTGDVIIATGGDYADYLKNPVVLAVHDMYSWPVGTAETIEVQPDKRSVKSKVVFPDGDPEIDRLYNLIKQNVVRGCSVQIRVHSQGPPTKEELKARPDWAGASNIIRQWSLIEWSICPIGMNQNALLEAVKKGLTIEGKVAEWIEPPTCEVPFKETKISEKHWDEDGAVARLKRWASKDGSGDLDQMDWDKYREGFAWCDYENRESFKSYRFPHHDVVHGELVVVREYLDNILTYGIFDSFKVSEYEKVGNHLAKHYGQWGEKAPWDHEQPKEDDMSLFDAKGPVPHEKQNHMDGKFDHREALNRVRKMCSIDGTAKQEDMNFSLYAKAFAHVNPERVDKFDGYSLLHHDVDKKGVMCMHKMGLQDADMKLVKGDHNIPEEHMEGVKDHIRKHYQEMESKPVFDDHGHKALDQPAELDANKAKLDEIAARLKATSRIKKAAEKPIEVPIEDTVKTVLDRLRGYTS